MIAIPVESAVETVSAAPTQGLSFSIVIAPTARTTVPVATIISKWGKRRMKAWRKLRMASIVRRREICNDDEVLIASYGLLRSSGAGSVYEATWDQALLPLLSCSLSCGSGFQLAILQPVECSEKQKW